jgi:short subunit fatty acids transporter
MLAVAVGQRVQHFAAKHQAKVILLSPATNGRATMTVKSKPGGTVIVHLISTSKFVAVSMADTNPAVIIFEQAPLN